MSKKQKIPTFREQFGERVVECACCGKKIKIKDAAIICKFGHEFYCKNCKDAKFGVPLESFL